MRRPCLGLAAAVLLGACYGAPPFEGPYRCGEGSGCSDPALVCDDGVCCSPTGQPRCRSVVLDGGTCANGETPKTYYLDQDGDGFGSEALTRLYCAAPVIDPYLAQGGDCDDGSAKVHPDAREECDGLDNDCDGEVDEGLPSQSTFYLDQDGDQYGDPASPGSFCAAPKGYVDNNLDCAPSSAARHPGATEVCDGKDDDCNGAIDDNVPDAGSACNTAKLGECRVGELRCSSGAMVCVQTVFPSADVCGDGKDNDCDGAGDNPPDCGGPVNFNADPNVSFGAKQLSQPYNGTPGDCVKNNPGNGEPFTFPTWTGSGATSHVAWAEAKSGYWDLTTPNARLRLAFGYTINTGTSRAWSNHFQPVVMLCGPGGHLRLVHNDYILADQRSGNVNLLVPVDGSSTATFGWVKSSDSSPTAAVLRQVKRIEVLIQPSSNTMTPSFTVNFSSAFGFP